MKNEISFLAKECNSIFEGRIIYPGFSIEGKCMNRNCRSKGKLVIDSLRFGDFDLMMIKSKCPLCLHMLSVTKLGLNNCFSSIKYNQN
jgi:hypothetical protein